MQILVPANEPGDWQRLLGDPEKHWRTGYSAKTLAHCWHAESDLPAEFRRVFGRTPPLDQLVPLFAIPEHKVVLPGKGYPTQMDVWVLGRVSDHLVSIGVEGKVAEPFGQTVRDWNPDNARGKVDRLVGLATVLGLAGAIPGEVHYQLVHRTAGAILEGKRFGATRAIMAIHAFDAPPESFEAFEIFVRLFDQAPVRNEVIDVGIRSGLRLYLSWIDGDQRFRTM